MKESIKPLLLCCFCVIVISLIIPAYGEVISFKTDKTFYKKGDKIKFSGTLDQEDVGGVVYIRIKDYAGTKAAFQGTFPDDNNNFEVEIDTSSSKNDFLTTGIYNATAFLTKIENGVTINFDFSLDGSPVPHPETNPKQEPTTPTTTPPQQTQPQPDQVSSSDTQTDTKQDSATKDDGKSIQEKINERIEAAKKIKELQNMTKQTNGNQVNQTNENSTVGNIPSDVTNDAKNESGFDSRLLYVILGVVGAGGAGAAVYVMRNKQKPRDYSQYFEPVEKTETSEKPSMQSEDDYALMILKNRLAKGEITIDEFNELKKALKEP